MGATSLGKDAPFSAYDHTGPAQNQRTDSGGVPAPDVPLHLREGVIELLRAFDYARSTDRSVWDFAVEIASLRSGGMTESDFRWLVCVGLVEHAREVTRPDEDGRHFLPLGKLSFAKRSCFILTERGALAAREICGATCGGKNPVGSLDLALTLRGENGGSLTNTNHCPARAERHRFADAGIPQWDRERRELRLRGILVKRFKWAALNQEIVLGTFQEEAWPARIDDPLPPQPGQDPKRRLHDTIKCLNRKQEHPLLNFRGDGTGEGVIWEARQPVGPEVD